LRVVDASIVERNAFGFENLAQNSNIKWLVVYNDISRINHSCVPNARTSDIWTSLNANPTPNHLGRMKVIATKDIEAGDEIFIEYLTDQNFWLQPRATRQAELLAHWRFT
jgi:SET domain-containing protein